MRPHAIRFLPYFALALLLIAPRTAATDSASLSAATSKAMAQAASPQAIAEYRRKLKEYLEARAAFEQEAGAYWGSIADKRRGGNGNHASQSGFHGSYAISSAIGYNQLLTTNTVELLAEQGPEFIKLLNEKAAGLSGPARLAMERKVAVLKKMVALARSVPDEWAQHEKIGDSPQGWALHAMVLDIDVGPMLQTHKLLTSVIFARAKGYMRPLTAAELEMINLTGHGTGLHTLTI